MSKQTTIEKTKDEKIELKNPLLIEQDGSINFILDKDTYDVYLDVNNGELFEKIDKTSQATLKKLLAKKNRVKLLQKRVKSSFVGGRDMGDRIFLYGPTGTGKTHSVLEWIENQKLAHSVITVSDGFEDIDFLSYILPTEKGIKYQEKKVVDLLRRASKGEKVAILIDEVNRGSKSFMNLVLKMLDNVSGFYEINNFVSDEVIKIPQENIIWFCTSNLGGGYSGTNDLDEALLDRFNRISFVGYNDEYEKTLFSAFGEYGSDIKAIVDYMRELFKENAVKRPISTRALKNWAEGFVNSAKAKDDVFSSFENTVMYRIISVDGYGFPNEDDISVLVAKFMDLGYVGKTKGKAEAKSKADTAE